MTMRARVDEPEAFARLVADLPPRQWAESLRRIRAIQRYRRLARPTASDAAAAARELGLSQRSFYLLVRIFGEHGRPQKTTKRQGGPRRPSHAVEEVIDRVLREAGPAASADAVHRIVATECVAKGLQSPGVSVIKTRLDDPPERPDLRRAFGTGFELIADAAPLAFDLDDGTAARQAVLAAVLDPDGRPLAHLLGSGGEVRDPMRVLDLLPPLPRAADPYRLLLTRGMRPLSDQQARGILAYGIVVVEGDAPRAGAALRASFGRRIGRVRILENDSAEGDGRSSAEAVPAAHARAIIALLVERHETRLDDRGT